MKKDNCTNNDENEKHCSIDVKAGQIRSFCCCGKSQNMPFCDGTNEDNGCKPTNVTFKEDKNVDICGCGNTQNPPFCDKSCKKEYK